MTSVAFRARYFDGESSTRHDVEVRPEGAGLRVLGPGWERDFALDEVAVRFPVAGTRHYLMLRGGGQLVTDDATAVGALFARPDTWLKRLESRWALALAAFAAIAVGVAWVVFAGLPLAAGKAAERVPEKVSQFVGEQALRTLDQGFCRPSALPEDEQDRIRNAVLRRVTSGLPDWGRYGVEFRDCRAVGANAFALPDATLVVTDRMVELAQSDEELAAVLAHEVGHVQARHGLRMRLQAAGLAVLLAGVTGDAGSISSLAPILPVLLLQSGYSRGFEAEADRFALERLRAAGIPTRHFAEVLERLERDRQGQTRREYGSGYLSTHPSSAERIEKARGR